MQSLLKKTTLPPKPKPSYRATTNGCNTCMPLGACLAFRGIEGAVPFLHGSQGCATYIRRYLISHFREPMDIASSAFGEDSVVFGGEANLHEGILNVARQYKPAMIGVATTCLAETIGDDVPMLLGRLRRAAAEPLAGVELVSCSTPAYAGTHAEGFWAACRAIVEQLATAAPDRVDEGSVAVIPGMVSPADLRTLRDLCTAFRLSSVLLPDYSETLQGEVWDAYRRIPPGGTKLADIRRLGGVAAVLEWSAGVPQEHLPSTLLQERFGTPATRTSLPIGMEATDQLMAELGRLAGCSTPRRFKQQRGRLLDAYIDGHKYTAGRTVAVYGDPDFTIGMTRFLCEIGLRPVLCATGARHKPFEALLRSLVPGLPRACPVHTGVDFADIESVLEGARPDLMVGSSKGYTMARRLDIPLLRAGFPIHDRLGGGSMQLVGYEAAHTLFEQIANLLIERRQNGSPVGYTYM